MDKMKLLVFIDQMEVGGAGRVCSILINELVKRGYEVILSTALRYHAINYHISEAVIVKEWFDPKPIKHGVWGRLVNMYNRHKYFRRILKEVAPDVIIVFMHGMFFYVKAWSYGYNIPIIVSDHTSMGRDLGRFANFIRHKYYAKADAVTILTEKDSILVGDSLPNKVVVYNPVTFDIYNGDFTRNKNILCVGRKDSWSVKGFDRMIEVWSRLACRYPEWKLEIVGPSSPKSEHQLRSMIDKFNISERVTLVENKIDMQSIFRQSTIFALPSRVEGFPIVLLEAMSQGCACISFSMQGAIEEIISNGNDGDIVDDNDLMTFEEKLEELILNEDKREAYSINARNNVARFSIKSFVDKWEDIINDIRIKR